jgi:UrcA family protein
MASSQTEELNMKSMKILMALAALSVTGITAAHAAARDTNSVVVRYGDLNLDSQAGINTLHKRIRNAAESVCGPLETKVLGLREAYDSCVKQAIEDGVAAVNNTSLSQFNATRTKRSVLASN